jgi:hypothetical protein
MRSRCMNNEAALSPIRQQRTGERAENPGKVEVTGKSERRIEKIEAGMVRRCGDDWYVDDFEEEVRG